METLTTPVPEFRIRSASVDDAELILQFIKELAEYEKLSSEVTATSDTLRASLFSERPAAEVIIGELNGKAAAFAIFFHNFSSFLGKPGLYLEDLFVRPEFRAKGLGREMFLYLARLAAKRGCGRFEWAVLDWNEPAIGFYRKLGAIPMDEWTVFRLTGDTLARCGN